MPDLLTHVLVGYIIGTIVVLRCEWAGSPHVTMVMIGALVPDFKKINLLVSDATVSDLLGIPWGWMAIHTVGGSVVIILLGSMLVAPGHRRRVIALLAIGATSHLFLDLLVITWSGEAFPVLWPVTEYRPPSGGLFRSSDRWPALATLTAAAVLWAVRRRAGR
ncbi:metal-dependent hydrolase [Natrarchaeobius halalkaliphilus]|uniref:Metal-dependent hydrolase n=1 Tax=Natrarchaeobius halalkaliphilus TaxID=1679091 RepID=A0A3N6MUZ8_9EURY|nr:metal-dependent hydrolase [Natrarchaeobius halalkaliphilus]RQG89232.1 metal-dependent hydrolase [Natrarchaeobius halalkaliphilus]